MQKLKNNEPRPKFTGSNKKKRVVVCKLSQVQNTVILLSIFYLVLGLFLSSFSF